MRNEYLENENISVVLGMARQRRHHCHKKGLMTLCMNVISRFVAQVRNSFTFEFHKRFKNADLCPAPVVQAIAIAIRLQPRVLAVWVRAFTFARSRSD